MTQLKRTHHTLLIAIVCLAVMAGCSPHPLQPGPLPEGAFIVPLPELKGDGPIAWHPSGKLLASGSDGLFLLNLTTDSAMTLSSVDPTAVIWSPDGEQLAVTWEQDDSTHLELWDKNGSQLTTTLLPGLTDSLFWSGESGLLVITAQLKTYSFGSDLTLRLHHWDGQNQPGTMMLHSTTIRPTTAKNWQQGLLAGRHATLSPSGDELLYLKLLDPPAFSGRYQLTLRHIATGVEKQVTSLPLTTRTVQFIDDERALVDGDGSDSTELFLWLHDKAIKRPYTGRPLAISPGGRYWLIGDHLLRDGVEIGYLPNLDQAFFSPDGSRLLLQSDKDWHILEGLKPRPEPAINAATEKKLQQLRNWRSRGLITPDEFRQQQQRMMSP